MDAILVNPEWIRKKGSIWKGVAGAMPPLGPAYIASYAEKHGYETAIIDMQVEFEPYEEILKKTGYKPRFVGISATTTTYAEAKRLAGLSRKMLPESKIVMGGVHPTFKADEAFSNPDVDFVIRGEGEETFRLLLSGEKPGSIPGLSYKSEGVITHNPEPPLIKNLDDLPFPAYHMLKMKRYVPSLGSYKRLPSISMITSRGCPGKCTYCFGAYLGGKIRVNSPAYVIEEIKMLQKRYGIREVSFYDDTFTAFKHNVREFCERLIKEKIDLTWVCFARVDFIDEDMLKLMKKAGCHQLLYGVESGDQEILKSLGKTTPLEKAKEAVMMTKKAGIECRTSFMLGSPGETEEHLKKTIKFSIELDADLAMYNVTTPFPGTKMYEQAKANGWLSHEEWDKYDFSTAVMELPGLSAETVDRYYAAAHKAFYGRPKYLLKRLLSIKSFEDIKIGFKAVKAIWGK